MVVWFHCWENKQQKSEASIEIWLYNILPRHYKISCPLPAFREMTHRPKGKKKILPISKPVFFHFKNGIKKKPNRLQQVTSYCNQLHSQKNPVQAQ